FLSDLVSKNMPCRSFLRPYHSSSQKMLSSIYKKKYEAARQSFSRAPDFWRVSSSISSQTRPMCRNYAVGKQCGKNVVHNGDSSYGKTIYSSRMDLSNRD